MAWAQDHGANMYCHWFQPLGAAGARHGMTGQVQNSMVEFSPSGEIVWKFTGKQLVRGETDGSSYPNGGLRATYRAGGYTVVDPTSPVFLRGDTVFIPACLVSYEGCALDEKVPLLRACESLSREGVRLLGLMGYKAKSLQLNVGLEQEFFLVSRKAVHSRPDLMFAGRTVAGKAPPKDQELGDHCKCSCYAVYIVLYLLCCAVLCCTYPTLYFAWLLSLSLSLSVWHA
jgi:glutamine synthetase